MKFAFNVLHLCMWVSASIFALSFVHHQSNAPSGKAFFQGHRTLIPDSQAGARLQEFLEAMNGKDEDRLRRLINGKPAKSPQGTITPEERFARLKSLREDHGPFELLDILDESPLRIIALLKDRDGRKIGLKLQLAADPPHEIESMMLGDPESLKEARPLKEYKDWKTLEELIGQIKADNAVPAMAIAVARDGAVIDQAVSGVREQGKPDKVQLNDRWQIGSIGKPMTATMIAMLIDKGVLRWDTTIGKALPGVKMQPGYKNVTIKQLLQHRGGIPQDMGFKQEDVDRITKNANTPIAIRAAYVADVLGRKPLAKPGERMAYSNAGYTIAGYIAEKATGKPYDQLMQKYVFKPLGMSRSRVGGAGEPGQPQGHILTDKGLQVANFKGKLPIMLAPAGDITCSIADLAKFAAFHLAGLRGEGRILKPETFKQLYAPPAVPAGQERYACGWEINGNFTKEPFYGHGGSNGTFVAHIAIFPKQNLAIAATMNAGGESQPSPTLQAALAAENRFAKR